MTIVKDDRLARIILDKNWDTPSRPLLKELNIFLFEFNFHKRLEYLRSILVFKALNNLAPNYIRAVCLQCLVKFIMRARETQSTI